ncbi:hypothetical protein MKEN_00279200 [Mycena kentingensis (nom. inval.)]|nr:hypothetical protein MKEN_00279200 [Mycena kentingensis (nom. inval.)]
MNARLLATADADSGARSKDHHHLDHHDSLDYASIRAPDEEEQLRTMEERDVFQTLEARYVQLRMGESALAEGQRKLQEVMEIFKRERKEAAHEVERLRRELELATLDNAALHTTVETSKQDVLASNEALYVLLKEHQELQQSLQASKAHANRLQVELREKEEKIAKLEDDTWQGKTRIARLDAKLAIADRRTVASTQRMDILDSNLTASQHALADATARVRAQNVEIEELKHKHALADAEAENRLRDLHDTIRGLIDANCQMESVIATLRARNEALEAGRLVGGTQGRPRTPSESQSALSRNPYPTPSP